MIHDQERVQLHTLFEDARLRENFNKLTGVWNRSPAGAVHIFRTLDEHHFPLQNWADDWPYPVTGLPRATWSQIGPEFDFFKEHDWTWLEMHGQITCQVVDDDPATIPSWPLESHVHVRLFPSLPGQYADRSSALTTRTEGWAIFTPGWPQFENISVFHSGFNVAKVMPRRPDVWSVFPYQNIPKGKYRVAAGVSWGTSPIYGGTLRVSSCRIMVREIPSLPNDPEVRWTAP